MADFGNGTRSLDLPPTARSTRDARHFVDAALAEWGLAGLRDTALLLTSEVVTNSVLHARSAIQVSIIRDVDGVTIEVTDGSMRLPVHRRQSRDATNGRGIELLQQLATTWDVVEQAGGKTIRFSLEESADPWAAYTNVNRLRGTSST